ncbi:MAG: hypothetical protein ACKO43_01815 [Alphaproteobacteria bacterium]
MLPLIFDSVLILFLLAASVGGWRLYKKILTLQALHQDFQKSLRIFDETSRQTTETLSLLEAKAKEVQALMDTSVARVDPVRQDLLFLCQRAESLADALMHTPKKKMATPATLDTPFPAPKEIKNLEIQGRSHAERELSNLMAQRQVS